MLSLVKKWATPVFYVLVAIFAVVYLTNIDWAGLSKITIDPLWLIVATLISLVSRLWFSQIWMFLLKRLGADLSGNFINLLVVYSKAWLGRYIPGGAAWILGKIYFASGHGVSKAKLAISSFLEGALQIIVVLVSGAVLLAFDPRVAQFGPLWVYGLLAISVIGLICVAPPVFNRLVQFGYGLVRKKRLDPADLPNTKTVLLGILAFVGSATLVGLSYFFIAKTLVPDLGFENVIYVIGTTNLASALSMLAVFAPAGLGVREAIQIATLLVIMDPVSAVSVTVFMRLWSIIIDVIFYAGALALKRFRR